MKRGRTLSDNACGEGYSIYVPNEISWKTFKAFADYKKKEILDDCIHDPRKYLED